MNQKINYIIGLVTVILLFSCTDTINQPGIQEDFDGNQEELTISLMVEGLEQRTRAVNFNEHSTVRINSVWMGVFDRTTGDCVGKQTATQKYFEINSQQEYKNLIRIILPAPPVANQSHAFFAVCIVNYQDVLDQYGNLLEDRLQDVTNWNEFIDIAVDTQSAYTYPHDADAPVMAGFLRAKNEQNRSAAHVQVDQFNQNRLYPNDFANDIQITFNNGTYITDNKLVLLRRLVANVNVDIKVENDKIKLTKVNFKRYNLPESVYIIERRTVDNDGLPPSNVDQVTNYADKIWAKSNFTRGYIDDSEWNISPNLNSETGIWSFSFQHFANKHWARNSINTYQAREARTQYEAIDDDTDLSNEIPTPQMGKGFYFNALTNSVIIDPKEDFNNNASYFVINMHLVDEEKNRCAEAEYMIHEGATSDADGNPSSDTNVIYNDFVCARNISYKYNITVKGFNNIFYNVDDSQTQHHPEQGGKVWQMIYANDPNNKSRHYYSDENNNGHFENICPPKGEIYSNKITVNNETNKYAKYEGAIKCEANPNLAFRLYGYTHQRTNIKESDTNVEPGIAGYNYNFESSSFNYLSGLWPPSAGDYSHYFMDQSTLDISSIPEDLRFGVLVVDPMVSKTTPMNIVEFIKYANNQNEPKSYDVYIRESELSPVKKDELENYIRAIYIADRKGTTDKDGCSTRVDIFCAVQEPPIEGVDYGDEENINFDIPWKYNELTDLYLVLYDYDMNFKGKYQFKGDYQENVWLTTTSIEIFNDCYFIITDQTEEKIKLGSNGEKVNDRTIPYILKPGKDLIEYQGGRTKNIFSIVKDENGNYIFHFRELT